MELIIFLFIMIFLHNKIYEVNLKSFKNRINTKFFDCQLWEADKKAKKTRLFALFIVF